MRKFVVFAICFEVTIYLLLYNLHGCTFNGITTSKYSTHFDDYGKM